MTHRPVSWYREASQPTDREASQSTDQCHGTKRPHNPQTGVMVPGGLTTHRPVSQFQEASQPTDWCHGRSTERPHNPQTGVTSQRRAVWD